MIKKRKTKGGGMEWHGRVFEDYRWSSSLLTD